MSLGEASGALTRQRGARSRKRALDASPRAQNAGLCAEGRSCAQRRARETKRARWAVWREERGSPPRMA